MCVRMSMFAVPIILACLAVEDVVARAAPNSSLPRPVPTIDHINGTTTVFDLARHLPGITSIAVVSAPGGLTVSTSGTSLLIGGSGAGISFPELKIEGQADPVVVVVRASNRPQITFTFRPTGTAKDVSVVGGFNGWAQGRNPMQKQADGSFSATLALDTGTYDYKFVVDGNWMPDPSNPLQKPDGFQGFNSVLTVEGDEPPAGRLVQARIEQNRGVIAVDSLTTGPAPTIDPDSVRILFGNTEGAKAAVDDNLIRFALPSRDRLTAIRVLAKDTRGRDILPAEFVFGNRRTWRDEILYFVFTDRFRDGDPRNNRPVEHAELKAPANYHGGDWEGLRLAIEEGYFKNLGVTALWISPPQRQPEGAWRDATPPNRLFTGYHGYWPVAAREVNPSFGTTESLKAMVTAAQKNGIKVIMDCVANHVHVDHPYYKRHPHWFGTYNLPDGRKNLQLFDEFPLTTWFDTFLPKFDYAKNPVAVKAVVDDMAWWVETFGFDGLRHDATKHIPHDFWLALTERLREVEKKRRGAAFYQVGESIASREIIMEFVNAAEMDGQFDFPLYWSIRSVFAAQNDGFQSLAGAIRDNRRVYGGFSIHSAFVGNHDFSRFMAFASGAVPPGGDNEKEIGWTKPPTQPDDVKLYDRLRMAHTFVMTQPDQAPLIYYGDEFGLTGAGDPDNRRPMLFGDAVPKPGLEVMKHVAALTAIRKANPALRSGDTTVLHVADDALALMRSNFSQRLLVAFNRADEKAVIPVRFPVWALHRFGAQASIKPLLADIGTELQADEGPGQFALTLPPRSSAIFLMP